MGRCTWPTRVGTDFEDDDGDTVVLQAYGTVIMYIYRRGRKEGTNGSTLHIEVLHSCSSAAISGIQSAEYIDDDVDVDEISDIPRWICLPGCQDPHRQESENGGTCGWMDA
jgi:hypothetical protein